MGTILPGRPIANVCFKTYGYMSMSQAISFLSDFKLGHYMKIPPRSMFLVQVPSLLFSMLEQFTNIFFLISHYIYVVKIVVNFIRILITFWWLLCYIIFHLHSSSLEQSSQEQSISAWHGGFCTLSKTYANQTSLKTVHGHVPTPMSSSMRLLSGVWLDPSAYLALKETTQPSTGFFLGDCWGHVQYGSSTRRSQNKLGFPSSTCRCFWERQLICRRQQRWTILRGFWSEHSSTFSSSGIGRNGGRGTIISCLQLWMPEWRSWLFWFTSHLEWRTETCTGGVPTLTLILSTVNLHLAPLPRVYQSTAAQYSKSHI